MKRMPSLAIALGVFAAACSTSDTVYEPVEGLECSTEHAWTEQSVILEDAEGLPTPGAAAEAGLARWEGIEGAEVVVVDSIGRVSSLAGVLLVDGRRVVLTFPSAGTRGRVAGEDNGLVRGIRTMRANTKAPTSHRMT